jgi:hypothetical protein
VVTSGSSITVYLDGTSVITATDSTYSTATKHGVWGYTLSGYVSGSFSNFSVTHP